MGLKPLSPKILPSGGKSNPFTGRALAVGLVGCVLIALAFPYANLVVRATRPANTSLPFGTVFFFFLLIAGLNPLLRAVRRTWGLSAEELTVVFVMWLIATAVPTWGLIGQLLPILAASYYATPENKWQELLFAHPPRWLAPQDPAAIRYFYEGLPPGRPIPWEAWRTPLLCWAVLIAALYLVTLCLMLLLREQWLDRERLTYPLMRLPQAMVEQDEGIFPPLLRSRAMWLGFGSVFFLSSLLALHYYFPTVPGVRLRYQVALPLREARPLRLWVNFSVLGFAYLISGEVALSLWVFSLVSALHVALLRHFGVTFGPPEIYSAAEPSVAYLGMGAMAMLVIYGFWTARGHLTAFWQRAVRGIQRPDEPAAPRWVLGGLVGGLAAMAGWLRLSGLSWLAAAIFLSGAFITFLALTRSIVQGGVPVSRAALIPQSLTIYTLGNRAIGRAGLTSLGYSFSWTADIRVFLMPFASHALKLWSNLPQRRRGFTTLVALALVVSGVTATGMTLWLAYTHGGVALSRWLFTGCPTAPFRYIAAQVQELIPPNPTRWAFLSLGAGLMGLLTALHYRFLWWPLHPLGFAVGCTTPLQDLWFSIWLGWLLQTLVLRYGGLRWYRRCLPFCLGLILGQFVACGLWVTIDAALGTTGNLLYVY